MSSRGTVGDRPPMTWRVVALVLAVLTTIGWHESVGWWPLYVLISLLTVDGVWAWIGVARLLRSTPGATPRVATPSDSTPQSSDRTPLPADLKARAKAVKERLRTDRLVE